MTAERLAELKLEAWLAASGRGHALGPWADEDLENPTRSSAAATCTNPGCDAWVSVMVAPPPNGIDVGGPAVATNCATER